ncbi:MAG: glycosyltransferase [Candidatus Aenigmarchaeota archaeon]|nr:glycosyltransferase [Candidatus Aenigmarchaeota archaeon]
MRIAHFSWESLHSISVGGISPVVTELAAAQERKGHEVHVFTRIGQGQSKYEKIDGVHYHRCPFAFNHELFQEMHNMCKSMTDSFFACEDYSGKFDILHGHDWHTVSALDEIKKSRKRNIIWTCHASQFGRDGNRFNNGPAEAIRNLEWYGTYISDIVTTCTETMKKEVQWLYRVPGEKMKVVHNGINPNTFNNHVNPGEIKEGIGIGAMDPTVVFIGRITTQHGPDILVESIPSVLRNAPNAKFVFIGDGNMKPGLEKRVNDLGVSNAVRFTGWISDKNRKEELLKCADVMCDPSRSQPFGVVVLETWACNKPVIATHGTGGGELVWHDVTGLKVYNNPNSIKWGINEIFSDFDKAKWMGENGRKATEENFGWDNIANRMLNVYEETIE